MWSGKNEKDSVSSTFLLNYSHEQRQGGRKTQNQNGTVCNSNKKCVTQNAVLCPQRRGAFTREIRG